MELPRRLLDVTENNFYFYDFLYIYNETSAAYGVPPNTISMFEFGEGIN
jgi:hypothetical protein